MSGTLGYEDIRAAIVRQKAVGFDRPMPEADFDSLNLPSTGTQPVGIPGAARHGGIRNRQAPRQPIDRAPP